MSTQRKLKSYLNSRSKHFPKWQCSLFYISAINISLHVVPFYLVRHLTSRILFICSGSCMFLHYISCTLHHLNTCWTKIVLPAKKNWNYAICNSVHGKHLGRISFILFNTNYWTACIEILPTEKAIEAGVTRWTWLSP